MRCWKSGQVKTNLRVKKSGIRGAGLGLFADGISSHKGEKITNYKGKLLTKAQRKRLPPWREKLAMKITDAKGRKYRYIDGGSTRASYARYANEASKKLLLKSGIIVLTPKQNNFTCIIL